MKQKKEIELTKSELSEDLKWKKTNRQMYFVEPF